MTIDIPDEYIPMILAVIDKNRAALMELRDRIAPRSPRGRPPKLGPPQKNSSSGGLTSRETAVINLLREGKSIKDVASSLKISGRQAERVRATAYRKLKVRSISELKSLWQADPLSRSAEG
jgi:DNA-binding NarL/FixJ family response regulator